MTGKTGTRAHFTRNPYFCLVAMKTYLKTILCLCHHKLLWQCIVTFCYKVGDKHAAFTPFHGVHNNNNNNISVNIIIVRCSPFY